jgi:hypothetical protein
LPGLPARNYLESIPGWIAANNGSAVGTANSFPLRITRKRKQALVTAGIAPDSQETSRQDSTVEEAAELLFDESWNRTIAGLLRRKKCLQLFGNNPVQDARFGFAWDVVDGRRIHGMREKRRLRTRDQTALRKKLRPHVKRKSEVFAIKKPGSSRLRAAGVMNSRLELTRRCRGNKPGEIKYFRGPQACLGCGKLILISVP